MKMILAVAPTFEPITSGELKMQLRVDAETFDDNLTLTQSLSFASHAIAADYTTHVGTGISVLGSEAEVLLHAGTNDATGINDTKIQESDDDITYTDWAGGAFDTVTTGNDNADYKKQYTGEKQYIRTASKVLLAACEFGTSILINAATTVEDDLITDIIEASREYVESITRRVICTQTWDYYLAGWPSDNFIKIPFGNLQSVTHVKWTDSDGTETTLTEDTDYTVETNGEGIGRIVLPYAESWPSGTLSPSKPIVIRFVAGWTTRALIPSRIKSAIKMFCAQLYEDRGEDVVGQSVIESKVVDRLLASSRLWDEF